MYSNLRQFLWPSSRPTFTSLCHSCTKDSSVEFRGRVYSLNLLVSLPLMQLRIQLAGWAAWHISQIFIHQYPQVLYREALNLFSTQLVLTLGVAPAQRQNLAFGHVKIHEVYMGTLLNPLEVPHQSSDFKKSWDKFLIKTVLSKNIRLNDNNNFQIFWIVLKKFYLPIFLTFSLSRTPRNYFLFPST